MEKLVWKETTKVKRKDEYRFSWWNRSRFRYFELHTNSKCKDYSFLCNCRVYYSRNTRSWFKPIEKIAQKYVDKIGYHGRMGRFFMKLKGSW